MEDVEKDVISIYSNKRESFAWGYRAKKYKLLLSKLTNNIASRKTISELLKIYLIHLFNFDF